MDAALLSLPPSRLRKLLFKYAPGLSPSGQSFTRSTTGTYTDANNIVQTAAINTLRDGHYIGGVPTTLLEGSRTNSLLWSRDLTNAAWVLINGTGTRTQNAVGLDGTANSATTVADTDAVNSTGIRQAWTIANDGAAHAVSVWVKKDTDQTRFPALSVALTGGTTTLTRVVQLNTQTGASAIDFTSGSNYTSRVVDAGLWWVLEIVVTNNTTGNVTLTSDFFPARGTVLGTNNPAATGSCVVGQVQVELNAGFYSSPIFTTTVAVTRGADTLAFPIGFPTESLTVYEKHIDLGSQSVSGGLYEVGLFGTNPSLICYHDANTTLASLFHNGTAQVMGGDVASAVVIGDTVETHVTLSPTGVDQLGMSKNAGAEVQGTASATNAISGAAWGGGVVRLGRYASTSGFAAFTALKIAAGVRSLADMRNL